MAYTYDFKNNVIYGAEDINGIRATMLTKGVIEDTVDSCKAVISEGKVAVSEGQAVFTDGTRIKIDSEGVELDYVVGSKNYVFFLNNSLAEICEVKVGLSLPEDDYILIAEIDSEGILTDKRNFAQVKAVETERFAASFSADFVMRDDMEENEIIKTITLPKSNCSLIKIYMIFEYNAYMQLNILPKENTILWKHSTGTFSIGAMDNIHDFYANGVRRILKYEVIGNQLLIRYNWVSKVSSTQSRVNLAGICQR